MQNRDVATDAMNRNALAAALVAGLVLLAGCSSGFTGSSDGTATGESALDGETTAEEIEGETGTVNMYISDEQNAIEDFEHLNVTITKVGVKPAGEETDDEDADDGDDTETEDGDTETEDAGTEVDDTENGTETTAEVNTTDSTVTETETPDADDEADEETESDEGDGADEDEADDEDDDTDEADDAGEDDDTDEADDAGDDADEAGDEWVEYEVDNRTVDLTQLKGANATKLSSLEVPNGSYDKVFVYVSEVDGTLNDGSDQRVKLPSGKLQLNSGFTVGNGEEVDFVFDITAVKAGNSGKYILKPVISESGTDVEIDDVDERGDEDDGEEDEREDEDRGPDERDEERADELNASFDGDVVAGENVTLRVTSDGEPAEGATVFRDGERTGTTDADGTYVIQVPDDAEELEVEVTHEGAEAELEVELDEESDGADEEQTPDETATSNESQRLTVG